jgi:uncharacterized protein
LGAWVYWRDRSLDVHFALLLALGLAGGAYFGALVATRLSGALLRRLFALLLVALAIRLFLPE